MIKKYTEEMYKGESNRSADPTIRGFLFQDLIALDQLIDLEEGELHLEWVEDIYCENDSNIEISQVKYYPKTCINYKEVYRELFYQFLRLKYMSCNKTIRLKLVCYTNAKVEKKDVTEVYPKLGYTLPDKKEILLSSTELFQKLYLNDDGEKRNKGEREKYIFDNVASKEVFDEFYDKYSIDNKRDIQTVREDLKDKLYDLFSIEDELNEEIVKTTLLARALLYMQESYNENNDMSAKRKRTKEDLITYINKSQCFDDKNILFQIKACISEYIDECYSEILNDESVETDLLNNYINLRVSTAKYMDKMLETSEGRFKLLNTVSRNKIDKLNLKSYREYSPKQETRIFYEHKDLFMIFIYNCWKIMIDINCKDFSMFINNTFSDYICFDFPNELKRVFVMSSCGDRPESNVENIFSRVQRLEKKPNKWYLRGDYRGRFNYCFDVAHINNESHLSYDTTELDEDEFYIECLKCIKIDNKAFGVMEKCEDCVFLSKCIMER